MHNEVKKVLILDILSKIGEADLSKLEPLLQEMKDEELLSEDNKILKDGKKALLLFRDLRKDALKELEVYKEVYANGRVTDARLEVTAFGLRGKMGYEQTRKVLTDVAYFIHWDDIVGMLVHWHQNVNDWQSYVIQNGLDDYISRRAQPNIWLRLGRNNIDAARTCVLLLDPAQNRKELINITRS